MHKIKLLSLVSAGFFLSIGLISCGLLENDSSASQIPSNEDSSNVSLTDSSNSSSSESSNVELTDSSSSVDRHEASKQKEIYHLAKNKSGYEGSYEDWVNSIKEDRIELGLLEGSIQWKYTSETTWNKLIDLSDLMGEKGDSGEDGVDGLTPEFRIKDGYLQYKYTNEGEDKWRSMMLMSSSNGNDTFTVTFEPNNGEPSFTQEVMAGYNLVKPSDPTAPQFSTFKGWYFEDTDKIWEFNFYTTSEEITLVAKWDYDDFTVNLDPNGGTLEYDSLTVEYSNPFELPCPERKGYEFTGWVDDQGKEVDKSSYKYEDDEIFTATWKANEYKITYVSDYGTISANTQIVKYDEIVTLSTISNLPEDYTLLGWNVYDEEDNELDLVIIGDEFTYEFDKNIILKAYLYSGVKDDLSKSITLKLSVNYNRSTGMKYDQDTDYVTPNGTVIKKGDFKPVWQEVQRRLNLIIDDVTDFSTNNAASALKNQWQDNQFADVACGNISDIVEYSVLGEKETILDISQYLKYMPNFSKFLEENPSVKLSITTAKHGSAVDTAIYYLPYFDGYNDFEKVTLLRADYVRKILDADYDATKDAAAGKWVGGVYQPECEAGSYTVEVPKGLEESGTKIITKAAVTNIVAQQNALAEADRTGAKMVKQLRDYIDARYGNQYAKRSDLFLGVDASYDADEMIALMRVVRNSPELLTGNAAIEMIPFVPREYNNQRIADMYRWAGQLWGVRGVESRTGYLYIDAAGKIQDARGDEEIADMLENLNKLYKEGLILQNFQTKEGYGQTSGKFAETLIVGGNDKYSGFMEYDYSQTQGVWNDKAGSKAIEGYDFRPVLGAVANWDDGDEKTGYFHFTESWRSVKTQGWCINAALAEKGNEAKLARALTLVDYFYGEEGHALNSYGPESEGYTEGTINYQGRQVPKFTAKALEQLNDSAIGKGSYTDYLRKFVGATLPVGYIKEQGMEYQCTSANSKNGLTIINKAIEEGTYKHVEVSAQENPFFTIVPSAFALSGGQAEEKAALESKDKLGSMNSNGSTEAWNIWDDYVMHGFGGTKGTETLETKEQYLALINTTWELAKLVKIYQDAYDIMTA